MSKEYTAFNGDAFWNDGYVQELDMAETAVYFHYITSPRLENSGVFKEGRRMVSFYVKTDIETVKNADAKLEKDGKIYRIGEWVLVPSSIKHQKFEQNKNVVNGIYEQLKTAPVEVLKKLRECGYVLDLTSLISDGESGGPPSPSEAPGDPLGTPSEAPGDPLPYINININTKDSESSSEIYKFIHTHSCGPVVSPGEPPLSEKKGVCVDSTPEKPPDSVAEPGINRQNKAEGPPETSVPPFYGPPPEETPGIPVRDSPPENGKFAAPRPVHDPPAHENGFDRKTVFQGQNKAENRPENNKTPPQPGKITPEYDRYAALHPGQSPPEYGSLNGRYETIRKAWNYTGYGVKLPECRLILPNLNARQREILRVALENYTDGEITAAIKNYMWTVKFPEKSRITLNYANMFNFLEKALPAFSDEKVFQEFYVLEEK